MSNEKGNTSWSQWLGRIIFFFPFQLVLAQIKKNIVLLSIWIILFGFISKKLGLGFGIPYLFLYPEFLGKVDFTSHIILGFACGGFIMAFNISSYILNAYSFPIIATLSRPFFKFCVNNFMIPVSFLLFYIYFLFDFQLNTQFEPPLTVASNMLGFIIGNIVFIVLSLTYFFSTNRSVFELLKLADNKNPEKKSQNLARGFFYRLDNLTNKMYRVSEFRVETYLAHPFKIGLARGSEHYDNHTLRMVFSQNHINASVFEALVILTIIILGVFRDNDAFQIPAGASIFAMFSMLIMIFSALYSWLKEWSTIVLLALIVMMSYWSGESLNSLNKAYGLDYDHGYVDYTARNIKGHNDDSTIVKNDVFTHLQILENWKKKNQIIQGVEKPKIVFVNVSGGGLRSSLWSYYALAHLDSMSNSNFLDQIYLITGSSGGTLGAAYLRELHYRRNNGKNIHLTATKYVNNISKDLLNPIVFTIAVHDLYFRFDQYFGDEPIRDRALAFEKQFHTNTEHILDKTLRDYIKPEADAEIPMIVLAPTILNDARKLIISSQPSSFLTNKLPFGKIKNDYAYESIEFTRFFKEQSPYNLKYSSALRMNATFPYILPNVSLPTNPPIEVVDAGVRDNFGMDITLQYFSVFRDWIKENTSGVVIIQLRDLFKIDERSTGLPSNFKEENSPLTAIFGNVTNVHNYIQDNLLLQSSIWSETPVEVINLQLKDPDEDKISLSWHLTKKEKNRIMEAIHLPENKQSILQLRSTLGF